MRAHLVEAPQAGGHRLAAELLGERDAVRLHRPVGVVGAEADPEPVGEREQHRLDLARGVLAQHVDLRHRPGEQRRVEAIEGRDPAGARYPERGELGDVMIDRGPVAPGPAGHDQRGRLECDAVAAAPAVALEGRHARPPCWLACDHH